MSEPIVMTVTGPLPARELGVTDAHEHLFLETPAQPGEGLDDLGRATEEVREAATTGIRAIVELTPIGLGRRPDRLRAVAEATGVAIVAATGYHRDAHYPTGHWALEASLEALAARILADLREGMETEPRGPAPRDPARAGVIKAGASFGRISPAEERRLRAAASGSRETGAAVVVHTEAGTCGAAIVELLGAEDVPANRVVLAHLDRDPDPGLHADLAARGVNLVHDTIGHRTHGPDEARIDLIEALVAAGHGQRLMLGLDLGRRSYLRAWGGGPGLRHLMADFVPRLRRRVGDEAVQAMLVDNPARVFALRPVA